MGNQTTNNTNTILDQHGEIDFAQAQKNEAQNFQPVNSQPEPAQYTAAQSTPDQMPSSSSISSLTDIHAIPEFQDNSKKNKLIALASIGIGILVLAITGAYYYLNGSSSETVTQEAQIETQTAETITADETTEEEMTQMEQPSGLLDDDPVISDINSTMTNSEDEDINKTSDDLEGFDFENIDLELQENPGL